MLDGKATEHAPYSQPRVEMSGLTLPKRSGVALLFHGQEVPWRLQLPASCIPALSGKAGWVKVVLGCPAVLLGMCKASRAQVAVSGLM